MDELVGSKIDQYLVLEELGEDTWGKLWKARSSELDNYVVLQQLHAEFINNPGLLEHITQTTKTALRWRHPAIARIFEFREVQNSAFIVREYIPGDNLQDLLERLREHKKTIPITEAIQFTRQVLAALVYAHQRGISHGDLTPQCIYLREEPGEGLPFQPVVANFGLHKPGVPYHLSILAYEPPELTKGEKFDQRSDIYSAGVLLYELATGKSPSNNLSPTSEDLQAQGSGISSLRQPRTIRPDLPEALEEIILKATAGRPGDRFPSGESMSSSLEEMLNGLTTLDTKPQGAENVASLLWALQFSRPGTEESALEKEEIVSPAGEVAPDSSQDKIHILLADKTIHTISFEPPIMTIGRGNDNDIVLNQPGVSRHHARIEFDDQSYLVIDLDSRNGSYIGNQKLAPDQPHRWTEGENLRVGETWLRLERTSQDRSTIAVPAKPMLPEEQETIIEPDFKLVHPDGGGIDLAQVKFSPGKALLGIYLESANLTVPPGGQVATSLLVINQAEIADQFRVTFIGIPLEWLPNRPQSISMQPASQRFVPITFHPARSAESRAGHHILTIRIASQNDITQVVEVRLAITISAFAQFTGEIRPIRLKTGAKGQVIIRNMGNLPETYSVGWDTKQRGLSFTPPSAKITLPPGQSGSINFEIKSGQRRWYGNETLLSYGVVVSSQSGQFQTLKGEYANRPLIPSWAPVALIVLCLVMACGALLFFNQVTIPARQAQETEAANQTAVALVTLDMQVGSTSTAQSNADATLSSGQAATATANWFIADDDQDGLPNSQEALFNTKPDQPDTDLDGLKDGDEIQKYQTNPLMPDSDGDGLNDGQEIEKNIDPLKRDTDGDGLEDGIDPDPGNAPTKTATHSLTTVTPTRPASTQNPTADLSIFVDSGAASAVPGASMTYTIRVRNNGPSNVTNAQVLDTFPDALINISWSCTATSASYCRGSNGFSNLNMLVDLLVGGEITFIVSGSVSPGSSGSITNSASVSAPSGFVESNSTNNVATDTDTLTPKVSFSLSLTDNRTEISPGQTNVYTIVATNSGPSTAVGVVISNVIPDALTSLSWTCTASAGSYCQPGGAQSGNVNASGTIRPGGSLSITVNTRVKDQSQGTISNTAYLSSPIDPTKNNKSATDLTTITPAVDLVMNVEAPDTASHGSTITYTLTITNTGPAPASNIVLTNDLPFSASFDASAPSIPTCSHILGTVTCGLGSLAPGASMKVTITVITPVSSGTITNQAEVEADELELDSSDNDATTLVQIF